MTRREDCKGSEDPCSGDDNRLCFKGKSGLAAKLLKFG